MFSTVKCDIFLLLLNTLTTYYSVVSDQLRDPKGQQFQPFA